MVSAFVTLVLLMIIIVLKVSGTPFWFANLVWLRIIITKCVVQKVWKLDMVVHHCNHTCCTKGLEALVTIKVRVRVQILCDCPLYMLQTTWCCLSVASLTMKCTFLDSH